MNIYDINYPELHDVINNMRMTKDYMIIDVPEKLMKEICHNLNLEWDDCRNSQDAPCGFRMLPSDYSREGRRVMDLYNISAFRNAGFSPCGKISDFISTNQINVTELLGLLEV